MAKDKCLAWYLSEWTLFSSIGAKSHRAIQIWYEFFEFPCNKSIKSQKNQDSSWKIRNKSFSLSLTDFGAKIRFSLGHFSQISLTFLSEILKNFNQNMVLSLLLCIFNDSLQKNQDWLWKTRGNSFSLSFFECRSWD